MAVPVHHAQRGPLPAVYGHGAVEEPIGAAVQERAGLMQEGDQTGSELSVLSGKDKSKVPSELSCPSPVQMDLKCVTFI